MANLAGRSLVTALCFALALTVVPDGADARKPVGEPLASAKAAKADGKRADRSVVAQSRACPPGLAKKDPACTPPGQAKKAGVRVGAIYDPSDVHIVRVPGLYGLGPLVPGSKYAIIGNQLVRIDPATYKVLSVIRLVDAILD
ncbi:MAG: hypothetical protein P3W90_000910 [Paracoccus sp. (in: a-proteobacteria)]|nr:hypothetical protein [Paracoccus sp. (in: a-proteobacteria)]